MPGGGPGAVKTAVEAVGATAAVRDCRRAPWLLLLNLAFWQCPTRLVQGWLDVPCRSLQRLQRVVRANPTAERRWGGVGSCTVVIFVTSHANAEAEARKDAGSCCVPVESEDGGNAANSTPLSIVANISSADTVNGEATYRLRATRRSTSTAASFVVGDRGLLVWQMRK